MQLNNKQINTNTLVVENIDLRDYGDFCDAYFCYAEYEDGTVLTDDELITLTENEGCVLNELCFEAVAGMDCDYDMER